jgi:hypothetical protein
MTTTAPTAPLTGDDLLAAVKLHDAGTETKSELVARCGYQRPDGKPAFTAFYEALIAAKGIPTNTDDIDEEEYDSWPAARQELYDLIHERLGEKWDHDDLCKFLSELDDIGITTAEQFEDAYQGCYDGWHWQRELGEELLEAYDPNFTNDAGMASWIVIDWEATWNSALRYDYVNFSFDGDEYVFRQV